MLIKEVDRRTGMAKCSDVKSRLVYLREDQVRLYTMSRDHITLQRGGGGFLSRGEGVLASREGTAVL